jgi:hypothetical protein
MNDINLQPFMYMMMTNSFKKGNSIFIPLLLLLMPFLTTFINHCIEFLNDLYDQKFNKKKCVSIKFPVHKVQYIKDPWRPSNKEERDIYSLNFKAINWFIKKNIKNILGINSLSEVIDYDSEKFKGAEKDFFLIPEQHEMILVCKINDIYAKIITNYNYYSDDDNGDKNNKKKSSKPSKNYELELIIKCDSNNELLQAKNLEILLSWVEQCVKDYTTSTKIVDDKLYIFEYTHCTKDEYVGLELYFTEHNMNHNKKFNKNLFFEGKDKMYEYINKFKYIPNEINPAEAEFAKAGCAYKSCMLFDGEPGTGKTTTIKAIARETNRNIIVLNMNRIKTSEEFESIIRKTKFNKHELLGKQLLFVIEDADATNNSIFLSRDTKKEDTNNDNLDDSDKDEKNIKKPIKDLIENIENGKKLMYELMKQEDQMDMSTLLNTMDGVIELDGVMLIISTNHKNKFDKAILRPGRIDYEHTFVNATNNIIRQMIKHKFDHVHDDNLIHEYYPEINEIHDNLFSPAEIQSICFRNNDVKDCIIEILNKQKDKITKK